jgi:hypothetical protein
MLNVPGPLGSPEFRVEGGSQIMPSSGWAFLWAACPTGLGQLNYTSYGARCRWEFRPTA